MATMEPRRQRCEACGAQFGCGADVGRCWCDRVTVDAETLARLRSLYGSCLCPDCLQALAARSIAAIRDRRQADRAPSIEGISASPRGESR